MNLGPAASSIRSTSRRKACNPVHGLTPVALVPYHAGLPGLAPSLQPLRMSIRGATKTEMDIEVGRGEAEKPVKPASSPTPGTWSSPARLLLPFVPDTKLLPVQESINGHFFPPEMPVGAGRSALKLPIGHSGLCRPPSAGCGRSGGLPHQKGRRRGRELGQEAIFTSGRVLPGYSGERINAER